MTWLVVAGDLQPFGGMDRANFELVRWLAEERGDVHVVAHALAPSLENDPRVHWHRVPRPFGRHALGAPLLSRRAAQVARSLPSARVVANGGNLVWPGTNWIHALHAAWNPRDQHARLAVRARHAWAKRSARRDERRALARAKLVITNSDRVREQTLALGAGPAPVQTVYYGVDAQTFRPFSPDEKRAARARLSLPPDVPVLLFVGALGHDRNKGFDLVFDAFVALAGEWPAHLVAAGDGAEVPLWREAAARAGLGSRVHLLGYSKSVVELLAAADALVSPTHYEAYGLAVHEALCCEVPALVTRSAGVAERFPTSLADLLLDDPPRSDDLARRLRQWWTTRTGLAERLRPFAARLRQRSWRDMAAQLVALAE